MTLPARESTPGTTIPPRPSASSSVTGALHDSAALRSEGLTHLSWFSDGKWVRLPDWARFILEVGVRAASFDSSEARLVVAVALPTSAFAAALAAAGAVVALFERIPAARDLTHHFEYLASLPVGTPVTLHERSVMVQGTLLGAAEDPFDGRRRLRIQLPAEIRHVEARTSAKVQVIQNPGALSTRRRSLVRAPRFLSFAAHGLDTATFCTTTRADCVIVGPKNSLKYELAGEKFGAGPAPGPYPGTLQELARTREFARPNDAYRSVVFSATPDPRHQELIVPEPAVAIFDGALAFNNWRSRWRESNCLIVLDRSSSSARDEAASINAAHAGRICDSDLLGSMKVPYGAEYLCFLARP